MNDWHPRMLSVNEEGWLAVVCNDKLMIFKPQNGITFILYTMCDCPWAPNQLTVNKNGFDRLIFREKRCYIYKARFQIIYFANIIFCFLYFFFFFFFWCF